LYWDRDYAATTRWGSIIAPPDFNPFAWPISRPHSTGDGRTRRRVNGGVQMQFGVPMRPGDRIQARSRIEGWQPKSGCTGDLLLVDFAHEWRNQRAETVRITVHTMVYS
jgi:hydroxyacyl-ACP dehydratase HTD2-like protein with hotdog domain